MNPVAAALASILIGTSISSAKPNMVIIMADDMGYGDAGCYGGGIPTPNLDRMAAEGMRFTDFHSSGNVCSPTRAGLMTGRYQQRAGIDSVINADPKIATHHQGLDPDKETTFAELLGQDGYATAIVGKWHLGYTKPFNPLHHGFDRFRGFVSGNIDYHSHLDRMGVHDWWDGLEMIQEEGYATHLINKHALLFIEENKNRPFCLYVAHEAVHAPWQGPGDPPVRGPDAKPAITWKNRERPFREMMIEMDKGVGEILDKLKELNLSENTLVFFLSDNGPAGGSAGPLRGAKGSNWEGGHRVPAIAWWPSKIPAGSTTDQLSISLDLMPTILALAGVDVPGGHHFDGIDLSPVLMEGKTILQRQLFWNALAMRDGNWKLVINGKGTPEGSVGLYDLATDLGEKHNLADVHPERVVLMRRALEAWREDVTVMTTSGADY